MPTKECKHETYTHGPKREGYKVFVCVACNQLIHRETPWDDWKLLKENSIMADHHHTPKQRKRIKSSRKSAKKARRRR